MQSPKVMQLFVGVKSNLPLLHAHCVHTWKATGLTLSTVGYCGRLLVSEMEQDGSTWNHPVSRPINTTCVLLLSVVVETGISVIHTLFSTKKDSPCGWGVSLRWCSSFWTYPVLRQSSIYETQDWKAWCLLSQNLKQYCCPKQASRILSLTHVPVQRLHDVKCSIAHTLQQKRQTLFLALLAK